MRLTGGEARGRRLKGPGRLSIRPTSDRVREALFDILGGRVRNAAFLDGFAGTGAVGVEALSRGARRVVFVERDLRAIKTIRQNLLEEAWSERHEIVRGDLARIVSASPLRTERFEIIFLDPPYDETPSPVLLEGIAGLLAPGGVVVIEYRWSRAAEIPATEGLRTGRSYRYGDTALTLRHDGRGGTGR